VAITTPVPGRIVEPDRSPRFAEATRKDFYDWLVRLDYELVQLIAGSLRVNNEVVDILHFTTKMVFVCGLVADLGDATVDAF
jgi:hypothetical protein